MASVSSIYFPTLFLLTYPPLEGRKRLGRKEENSNDLAFWQANPLPSLVSAAGLLSVEYKQTVGNSPWNSWVKASSKALSFGGIYSVMCDTQGRQPEASIISPSSQTFFPGSGLYSPSVFEAIPPPVYILSILSWWVLLWTTELSFGIYFRP